MLDVRALCSFADYFVICTGDTKRHIEAIWQGTDFGSVIVHIFGPAERGYYQLEQLWDKAIPVVRIQ